MTGACIERGRITEQTDEGYRVASLDCDGIISPPLLPIDDKTYTIGEVVYFFLFHDGTGRIICNV